MNSNVIKTWNKLNKVILLDSNMIASTDMLTINQKSVTNIEEISNEQNYHFSTEGANIGT